MLEALLLAYGSGLLAAVSPCVVMVVPMLLYRFLASSSQAELPMYIQETASKAPASKHYGRLLQVLLFMTGFQVAYVTFGYLLASLLSSSVQNGIKLGLGALFTVVSALSLVNRIDPLNLPMLANPFYMGVTFALVLSINPCTVPFLAIIISMNTSHALLAMIVFAQGLITPALIFMMLGPSVMKVLERWINEKRMLQLKKVTNMSLFVSGVYMMQSIHVLSVGDRVVVMVLLILTTLLVFERFTTAPESHNDHDHTDHSNHPQGGQHQYKNTRWRALLGMPRVRKLMLLGIIAMILSGTGLLMTATHDLEAHQAFTDALSITPAAVVVAVEVEVGKGVEEEVLVYESAVSSDDPGWADDSAAMEILAKYRTAEELKQAQREPVHVQLSPPTEEEEPDDELMCVDLSLLKPCDPCKSGIQGVTAGTIALSLVILLTGASKKTVRALFKRCRRSRVKQKSAGLP